MSYNLRHTVIRSGAYYYNRRVPQRAVEGFGRASVRVSLGRCPQVAERVSQALTERLEAIWQADTIRSVDVEQLVASLQEDTLDLLKCTELYLSLRDIDPRPVELAVRSLIEVAGNRPVETYKRADARAVVGALGAKGNKSATIRRRVQSLHAILEFGYHELDEDRRNPFARLQIPSEGRDSLKRGVFTQEQLADLYTQALHSQRDTRLILPVLGETGARLAEIVGLRWEDVCLREEAIQIVPHPLRRLKTRGSEREVPLVGAALEAMRRLHRLSSEGPYVFPRWAREDRFVATHASNTLNKYIRSQVAGLTCHCLRHTMRDRLRNASCSTELVDQIGGWSSSLGVGARYGHGYSLKMRRDALHAVALPIA